MDKELTLEEYLTKFCKKYLSQGYEDLSYEMGDFVNLHILIKLSSLKINQWFYYEKIYASIFELTTNLHSEITVSEYGYDPGYHRKDSIVKEFSTETNDFLAIVDEALMFVFEKFSKQIFDYE